MKNTDFQQAASIGSKKFKFSRNQNTSTPLRPGTTALVYRATESPSMLDFTDRTRFISAMINITADEFRHAADIKEQIESLEQELDRMMGGAGPAVTTVRKRRGMSAAGGLFL